MYLLVSTARPPVDTACTAPLHPSWGLPWRAGPPAHTQYSQRHHLEFYCISATLASYRVTKAATGENGKNSGRRLFVLTLIEGVDDDEGRNARSFERTNDDLLHLGTERLPSDSRIGPQDLQQFFSKLRILICELECECWEDRLNVAPVLEISRAKEAGTKLSLRERDLGERLGERQLPVPASPLSQNTRWPCSSSSQSLSCRSTPLLVP